MTNQNEIKPRPKTSKIREMATDFQIGDSKNNLIYNNSNIDQIINNEMSSH